MSVQYSIEDFLNCEIKRIEIDKWNEGIRIQSDPGNSYVLYWVEVSASAFRIDWENSVCLSCKDRLDCGWTVKAKCNNYKQG
jgi:hypothetical protein